jgi:hypothetical protein
MISAAASATPGVFLPFSTSPLGAPLHPTTSFTAPRRGPAVFARKRASSPASVPIAAGQYYVSRSSAILALNLNRGLYRFRLFALQIAAHLRELAYVCRPPGSSGSLG